MNILPILHTANVIVLCLILLVLISMGIDLYGVSHDWWRSNGTFLSPSQRRELDEQFLDSVNPGYRAIYAEWLEKRKNRRGI